MSKLRLLAKREIDAAKAKDRQQEVTEGAKLAKRVDDLRKMLTQEEARVFQFRKSATEQINAEIKSLLNKRDMLKQEIKDLDYVLQHRLKIKEEVEKFLQAIAE